MFHQAEIARLQKQKELLVLQSDVRRRLLAVDWQRVRAPESWLNEGGNLARRHPLWTAVLAAGVGMLAVEVMRQPGAVAGVIGRLGRLGSLVLAGWKMFRGENDKP
ncbi:MAG TPA: hypothetical protein VNN22_07685 [Verrucomicrobiae bacterium]|nr:hypothetical protein [Verrucomicrobiae bacterium]